MAKNLSELAAKGSAAARRRTAAIAAAALAAAWAGGGRAARADVSGFGGFAPANTAGSFTTTPGYSADGNTFQTTDGGGGQTVTGFASSQQLVTSFDATFTLSASNGSSQYMADGTSLIFSSPSNGTAAIGGGGGSVGYEGITNSAAVKFEYFGYVFTGGVYAGYTNFGTNGAFTYGNKATTVLLTQTSPEAIKVNVSYYGTTLGVTMTNTTSNTSVAQTFTGVNLPAAIGGNTALVGFGSATGGYNMNQSISAFKFVSAPTFNPIALTAGSFNQDVVVEKGASQTGAVSAVTASMDGGTANPANNTWYEQGYNTAAPTTGLPASGSTFTSQGDSAHRFTVQSYNGSNVLLIGASNAATTGTLTFATAAAYRSLSFLTSSSGGPIGLLATINYANGHPSDSVADLISPDWFQVGNLAYNASGRTVPGAGTVASTFNSVASAQPDLWESDLVLPDSTDPIASVTLTYNNGGGRAAIFALSGASVVAQGNLTYTGTGTPAASFDTAGSLNFQNNGTPTAFGNGNSVLFDDTATGNTAVTVQAGGVVPQLVTFNNNSKNYTFNGGPISAAGASFNGSGTVTFNDAATFTGATAVNAGTVVVGATGSLNTSSVAIASGATLNVSTGGQVVGAPPVANAGTLVLSNPTRALGAYTGAGTTVLNGTALAVGAGTNYAGPFTGTGGSFNLGGGTYTPPSPTALNGLTAGGIYLGPTPGVPATLVVPDNSGTYGQTSSGAPITLTLGPAGILTGPGNVAWGGNIALASTGGVAVISAGVGSEADVIQPITGAGTLLLGAGGQSTTYLYAPATYAGETQVGTTVGGAQLAGSNVTLKVNNGASANAGLNFVNTNGSGFTFDMNGFNQAVTYLTGSTSLSTVALTNSGATATLTVSSGNAGGFPASFGVPITGNVNLAKAGAGNQILAAANTYNGFTNVSGGTLTVANTAALSNSTVTLTGGTLGLSGVTSRNAATLTSFANFQVNTGTGTGNSAGGAITPTQNAPYVSADNATLLITSNNGGESNSAFLKTPVTIPAAGFFSTFTYQNSGGADGITFVLQNDARGAAAIGSGGGSLGYNNNGTGTAVSPSGAVQLNIYQNGGTGFGTNGTLSDSTPIGNVNLAGDTNPLAVSLTYNALAQTLTETVTDTVNGSTGTITYGGVNFAGILGGNTAYVGFTGATGGVSSAQTISNFSFGSVGNGPLSIANAVTTTANQSNGIELNVTNGFTSASIGSLTVVAGAKVTVDAVASGTVTHGVLTIPTLTIAGTGAAPTGVVDVLNNDLDLPGASLATVTALVRAGYANGTFAGQGITSSTALANARHTTAVGVIANNNGSGGSLFAANGFDGATAGLNDVLVKYTYFGDANLDGVVNGADYTRIDAGYAARNTTTPLTGWYNGDFNYDGKVDGSDYTLIDNAFNLQQASLANPTGSSSSIVATSTAEIAGGTAAVPEPASVGLLVAGGLAAAARRRRRA